MTGRRCAHSRLVLPGLAVLGLLWTGPLRAQSAFAAAGTAEASLTRLVRDLAVNRTFAGPALSAVGQLTYGRFALEGRYTEATLAPDGGTPGSGEDLVDGALVFRIRVRPWLSLGGGPHLRAFITPAGTSQWTRVEARARVEGEVINGLAFAHFEAWYALVGNASVQGGGTGAQGGEAALTVRLPRTPVALRLLYSADRATFVSGGAELLESVGVALVIGRP